MDIDQLLSDAVQEREVRSWTGKLHSKQEVPITLYGTPVTAAMIETLSKKYKNFMSGPTPEALAYGIMRYAKNDQGQNVFKIIHFDMLKSLPATLITNIFNNLFGDDMFGVDSEEDELEERKGN